MAISLGSCDGEVSSAACTVYVKQIEEMTRVALSDVANSPDKLAFTPYVPKADSAMTVAEMQQGLITTGFFPGGIVDGICGYRTLSALRLFQEYVRSYEKLPCLPNGSFDATSQQHLQRWVSQGKTPAWNSTVANWKAGTLEQSEYTQWLALLEKVKEHYSAAPSRVLEKVNAFPKASDTKPVAQWDFSSSDNIHLIGVRRNEISAKFDDIFVLLIKGMVFKFQGSTEPGASENAAGAPFLVPGQHDYHFGWHKRQYLALRPQHLDKGVLVVRAKNGIRLSDADLNQDLEANASINIHWGGKGLKFDVKTWSVGCQVINGSVYFSHENKLINCASFAATNNAEIASNPSKTRGAYNVLLDLVTALSSDLPKRGLKYTLLTEPDLEWDPALKQQLVDARAAIQPLLG